MRVTAVVAPSPGATFSLRELDLLPPSGDELLVRVLASGVCATDSHARDAYYGTPFPSVFGHEGVGVVESVGDCVKGVRVGDTVAMVAPSCGGCGECGAGRVGTCQNARRLKMGGKRRDGRAPFADPATGDAVHGAFFQQSSFATRAVCTDRNFAVITSPIPPEVLAALPCGANSGAGAVANVLRPGAPDSLVVFGCGPVGLAGIMAARRMGCRRIVAVDPRRERLSAAADLGASDVLATAGAESPEDLVARIRGALPGGASRSLEAVGDPSALRAAVGCLGEGGTACLVGSARPGTDARLDMSVLQGRSVVGCVQGGGVPAEFVREMVSWWEAGEFPVDRLVKTYAFEEVNEAVRDAAEGRAIKAVLRIGEYGD
ncbi:Zn-dependent alcohol dehydrogenase, class III [Hyaloraphidium curvatum]|nr:Zn-dependent alcohol dehydrogenase, class III [Hyaloraphidium curvatum]